MCETERERVHSSEINKYVDIDQGIHKGKMKVALNEKQKKLHGFSFSINIANFEAFHLVLKLTKNLFFLRVQLHCVMTFVFPYFSYMILLLTMSHSMMVIVIKPKK